MSLEFNWVLPTSGDGHGRFEAAERNGLAAFRYERREAEPEYLVQVAQAAEWAGFNAAILPGGPAFDDGWLTAAALAQSTSSLKFLVDVEPGIELPAYTAQKVATLQTFTANRLLLRLAQPASAAQYAGYGDFEPAASRQHRSAEFLRVLREVWSGPGRDFDGEHYHVRQGGLTTPLGVPPAIYVDAVAVADEAVLAPHAGVYVFTSETPQDVAQAVTRLRKIDRPSGTPLRFGLRAQITARASESDAQGRARSLQSTGPLAEVTRTGTRPAHAIHLVGSYAQVAAQLRAYADAGVTSFALSAPPHLEEAFRTGENLLPLLH